MKLKIFLMLTVISCSSGLFSMSLNESEIRNVRLYEDKHRAVRGFLAETQAGKIQYFEGSAPVIYTSKNGEWQTTILEQKNLYQLLVNQYVEQDPSCREKFQDLLSLKI